MKSFKLLDFWISCGIIFCFTVLSFGLSGIYYFFGCFVIGCWQMFSMLVHGFNRCFTIKGGKRYYYHFMTAGILLLWIPGIVFQIRSFAYPIVFICSLMSVYYTWICYDEVFNKMQRPLALLK